MKLSRREIVETIAIITKVLVRKSMKVGRQQIDEKSKLESDP